MGRILIVDDEAEMRRALRLVLTHNGYQVEEAPDGPTALTMIGANPVDLVLLDIRMPGMDGIQTLRIIRQTNRDVPVVMVTGYGSEQLAKQSLQLGANHYLSKPFDNSQLIATVRELVAERTIHTGKGILKWELLQKFMAAKPSPAAARQGTAKEPESRRILRRQLLVPMVAFIAAATAGFLLWKFVFEIRMDFPIPHSHPSGMVYHQGEMWISDWMDQTIYRYQVKGKRLTLVKSYHLPDAHITGFALTGDAFYACDSWKGQVSKRRLDEDLTLIEQYTSPGGQPSCLFWDGKYLWSCDSRARKIYQHQADKNLTVLQTFPVPANSPVAVYKGEQFLWSADADTRKIYQHKLDSQLTVIASGSIPELDEGKELLSAFTLAGNNVWIARDGMGVIYRRHFGKLGLGKLSTE